MKPVAINDLLRLAKNACVLHLRVAVYGEARPARQVRLHVLVIVFLVIQVPAFSQSLQLQSLYTEKSNAVQRNDLEAALSWGIKATQQAEKEFGKTAMYANYAFDLASLLTQLKDYERAEDYYRECLAIYEKEYGKDHEFCGTAWMTLATVSYYRGDKASATQSLEQAQRIYSSLPSGPSQYLPQAETFLDNLYAETKNYPKLIVRAEKALPSVDKKSEAYFQALNNLGYYCGEAREFEKSENYYRQSLAAVASLSGDHSSEGRSVADNMGVMLTEARQFEKAKRIFEDNLKRYRGDDRESIEFAKTLNNLAYAQAELRELKEAIDNYKVAIGIYQAADYGDSLICAASWLNLASVHKDVGDLPASIAAHQEAMRIYKAAGGDQPEYIVVLNNLANVFVDMDQFEKAEPMYVEALAARERRYGTTHPEYGAGLGSLGHFYERKGDYPKAEDYYSRSEKLLNGAKGRELDHLTVRLNLAYSYRLQGKFAEAERSFKTLLVDTEKLTGKKSEQYAFVCHSFGLTYDAMGLGSAAEPLLQTCESILKSLLGENHSEYAIILNDLGLHYQQTGRFSKAGPYFQKSLEIKERVLGPNHSSTAVTLNNMGIFYFDTGDYGLSEVYYKRALAVYEKVFGREHPHFANTLGNLGRLYFEYLQAEKAAAALSEAYQIQERVLGDKHPSTLSTLNFAGSLYSQTGQYAEAEEAFKECLAKRGEVLGKEHPAYLDCLINLGDLCRLTGRYPEAEKYYEEAITKGRMAYGKDNVVYGAFINNKAILHIDKGELVKARELMEEVYRIRKKNYSKEHPEYISIQSNLAEVYRRLNLGKEAEPLYREVNQSRLKQIRQLFPYLSERERTSFIQLARGEFNAFGKYVYQNAADRPGLLGDLFDLQIAAKGLLLSSQNEISKAIARTKDEKLMENYTMLKSLKEQLAKVYKLSEEDRVKQGIDILLLEAESETIEKSINLKVKTGLDAVTWKELQAALGTQEALVDIDRVVWSESEKGDSSAYIVLVIEPTSKLPEALFFSNGRALETRLLKLYQNAIKFEKEDARTYEAFWKPIADRLQTSGTNKIYLSPDGVFNQINPNTLRDPATKKYVIETTDIRLLGNPKDVIVSKRREAATGPKVSQRAELFGFPDYDNYHQQPAYTRDDSHVRPTAATRDFSSMAELPGTKKEVETIEKILVAGGYTVTTHTRERASEDRVKNLEKVNILHIATHGFFSKDDVFGNSASVNPLLRSGLLFAGAKNAFGDDAVMAAHEDGVLTAYEAMNLDLEDTELVVLSACETGLGEVQNGEGVYGLQRSFLAAGAQAIIMSLWTVNDAATQELMTAFYANWMRTRDKRVAFREAQSTLRQKHPNPFYWGGFVLVGE